MVCSIPWTAWGAPSASPELREYVSVDAPVVALKHVRVIDGTGAPATTDQTVVIQAGRIAAVGPASSTRIPKDARVIEIEKATVMPGLVGMHDHLYYSSVDHDYSGEMPFSFPRLYLAAGVTTIRTAGAMDPYTDLALAKQIDAGRVPGPHVFVTGPFIEGRGTSSLQMHELADAEDAHRTVEYWATVGATSFKVYQHITGEELAATIDAAHRRRLKVTGHLCSITFHDAIQAGIDGIEHGPFVSGANFVAGKPPDVCPDDKTRRLSYSRTRADGPEAQALIQDLVRHRVALTSTLPVFEELLPNRPPLDPRMLRVVTERAEADFLQLHTMIANTAFVEQATGLPADTWPRMFRAEMAFERAFVAAGGLLLAGCDPTGNGSVIAGYGDQREIELLVEAGFSAVEAIHIATQNGARFLDGIDQFGSIKPGLRADLVVLRGDPTTRISDIENVEIIFKDGIGFDPHKLADAVRGLVGRR
jgi:imidazolonepropionase-like amidohydrolase